MNVNFRILDAAVPEDRAAWLEQWAGWSEREVAAHPVYVELFAAPGDRALAAVAGSQESGILFPVVARNLRGQPWVPEHETLCDLTTPYGYGGAYAWGDAASLGPAFWRSFADWALSAGAVCAFARLSLFSDQILPFDGDVVDAFANVVVDLRPGPEQIWRAYAHKVRKNVMKARRSELTVEVDETGSRLADFLAIYYETMDRRSARDDYYFEESFFRTIVDQLPGNFVFFHVTHEGRMISTELVLSSTHHLYSFLGGTRADSFELRPNDLLKHSVVEWGAARGKHAFVLGGGYGGEDGIYRYKLSFAPEGAVPFRTAKRVFDTDRLTRLVDARARFEREQGRQWSPRPDFFPPYRS